MDTEKEINKNRTSIITFFHYIVFALAVLLEIGVLALGCFYFNKIHSLSDGIDCKISRLENRCYNLEEKFNLKNLGHNNIELCSLKDSNNKSFLEELYKLETEFLRIWLCFATGLVTIMGIIIPLLSIRWIHEKEKLFDSIDKDLRKKSDEINRMSNKSKKLYKKMKNTYEKNSNVFEKTDEIRMQLTANELKGDVQLDTYISKNIDSIKEVKSIKELKSKLPENSLNDDGDIMYTLNTILRHIKNTKDALKFKRAVQYTAQYLIVKGLDQNFVNKLYSDINDTLSKETKESYIGHFSTEVSQSDTSIYNYLINIIKELNGAKQIIDKVRQWRDDYKDI